MPAGCLKKKSTEMPNWFLLFICLLLAACGAGQPGTIRDLEVLPQDAAYYLKDLQDPFLSPERQAALYADFRHRFFDPWHRQTPKFEADEVFSGFRRYGSRRIYGETNLPLPRDWIGAMARELPGIYGENRVLEIVEACLALYKDKARGGKRFAEVLDEALFEDLARRFVPLAG